MGEGGRGGIRKRESKSILLQRMESGREHEERTGKMKGKWREPENFRDFSRNLKYWSSMKSRKCPVLQVL